MRRMWRSDTPRHFAATAQVITAATAFSTISRLVISCAFLATSCTASIALLTGRPEGGHL